MPKKSTNQEIDVLNVRLPEDILSWVDSLIDSGIYSNRSEVIRDILREFVIRGDNKQ